jgi:hypothetical protein
LAVSPYTSDPGAHWTPEVVQVLRGHIDHLYGCQSSTARLEQNLQSGRQRISKFKTCCRSIHVQIAFCSHNIKLDLPSNQSFRILQAKLRPDADQSCIRCLPQPIRAYQRHNPRIGSLHLCSNVENSFRVVKS